MSKRIVVTGATGFLGGYLCRALIERGHTVEAYRRATSNRSRLGAAASQVRWHQAPEELAVPFQGPEVPDAVIHAAALYGRRGESPAEMIEANTLLPVRLYHLAAKRGVPLFLNADTILEPRLNPYALSKHQAVEWLKLAGGPTRVLNLKVQHFYGPHDDPSKFVTGLIRQCLANVAEIELTDGRQQRDFIYVEDVVSALLLLVERPAGDGPAGGFLDYEIGCGAAVEVRHLAERIHALTASRSRLLFGARPYRSGEPMLAQADPAALRALGWQPAIGLEEGLRRTIAAEQGLEPGSNPNKS